MLQYFTGDELGAVKSVKYAQEGEGKEWKSTSTILASEASTGRVRAIQKLAVRTDGTDKTWLAASRADGSTSVLSLEPDNTSAKQLSEWTEKRLKQAQRFAGSAFTQTGVYTCTSNGALRLTKFGENYENPIGELATIPMRLMEWRLAPNEETFAYAGDEVELSVWNTEQVFSKQTEKPSAESDAQSKKRKREQLLPGEIWRAKNLPNDNLNLRQPVRNTALTYLNASQNQSQQHLLVGTQLGDVRRYDTRAARRPVANWQGIAKVGGIGVVENGACEHQAFVADHGSNLFALDLRNGQISFAYKGLAGAVTSVAPSVGFMTSVCEDRYLRLHSSFPPPAEVGQQQEHKGEVLDKLYMKVKPTVVVWDGRASEVSNTAQSGEEDDKDENDDDVWNKLQDAESDDEAGERKKAKKE